MLEGVSHKFQQITELADYFTNTGNQTIIESLPYDLYWGSGCKLDDQSSLVCSKHKGLNKLGTILMKIRDNLSNISME